MLQILAGEGFFILGGNNILFLLIFVELGLGIFQFLSGFRQFLLQPVSALLGSGKP
jgi:hypothetical protein